MGRNVDIDHQSEELCGGKGGGRGWKVAGDIKTKDINKRFVQYSRKCIRVAKGDVSGKS